MQMKPKDVMELENKMYIYSKRSEIAQARALEAAERKNEELWQEAVSAYEEELNAAYTEGVNSL